MKKPAPFLCVFVLMLTTAFQPVFAQSDTPSVTIETDTGYVHSFREVTDSALMHLNFSEVTSGILADKGYPFGKPHVHNGQLHEDNYANTYDWYGNFALFSTGCVNGNTFFPNRDTLYEQINQLLDKDTVPIGMMLIDYHSMDTNALANGLFELINGQLYDDTNRAVSPYLAHRAFIASPLKLMADSGWVTFLLPSFLLMNNTGNNITGIECEVDGSVYEIYAGQVFAHLFTRIGETTLTFTLYLSDGSSYRIRAMMHILRKGPTTAPDEHFQLTAGRSYNGKFASGTVSIRYGCGNSRVRKPLIIVEGWDPPELQKFGMQNTSFNDLIDNLPPELRTNLASESYDIIFLDFRDGADYIQANAYLLEDLITLINNRKQEGLAMGLYSEPNIIVGFSMGALVTRYALLDMENRNEQHDTRTYFSVDGPHQGAYVPVGIQLATKRLLKNKVFKQNLGMWIPQLKWADEILERPASKQMLIYRVTHNNDDPHIDLWPVEYHSLQDEFVILGSQPTQTKSIAISSGSDKGLGQSGFSANDLILEYNYGVSAIFGNTGAIVFTVLTGLSFEFKAKIFALPDASQGKRLIYEDKFKAVVGGLLSPFQSNDNIVYKMPHSKPYEICPGGYVNLDTYSLPTVGQLGAVIHKNRYTFVPSISSLDIRYPHNQDLFYNINNNNVVATSKTLFKSYQAAVINAIGSLDNYNNHHALLVVNSNNNTNAIEIIDNTIGTLSLMIGRTLPANTNLFTNFNYGRNNQFLYSTNSKLRSVKINSNVALSINSNVPIGYNNVQPFIPPSDSTNFRVFVEGVTCTSPGVVDVYTGGLLEIGYNSMQTGELIFLENSILELAAGSTLKVKNNSKVIFEKDQFLYIMMAQQ